jgi:dihydropyrimidinase
VHPKKGALVPGADADVVVWDPALSRTISAKTHHQNIDFNIYEGMEVVGNPVHTFSRGAHVYDRGQLRTVRGAGRYVNRPCDAPFWSAQRLRNGQPKPGPVDRG